MTMPAPAGLLRANVPRQQIPAGEAQQVTPKSHAQQMLISLYREVLRRLRGAQQVLGFRPRMEELPQRMLFSVVSAGNETLVNTGATGGVQVTPDVAVSSGGVISYVWATSGGVLNPSTAIRDDGEYIAVWDISGDIHGQLHNADGTTLGSEFIVNNVTAGTQSNPDVAMDATGDFVVTWDGSGTGDTDGVFARRFNSSGTAIAGQFRVNTTTSSAQHDPAVAMAADGSFFVTYSDDNSGGQISGEYFNAGGVGLGITAVDSNSGDLTSAVAATPAGAFVVSFTTQISGNDRVMFRRYNGTTALDTSSKQVDSTAVGNQTNSSVAMDAAGNFIVAWQEDGRDGSGNGIFARRFFVGGTADGSVFRANTTTIGDQLTPAVAMNAGGAAVIVWSGNGTGDSTGIFAQQFATVNTAPVNTVPSSRSTLENTPLVLSSSNSDAISISDLDAGSGAMQVTLSVDSGNLTLASTSGLTFTTGDGANDPTLVFTGTINAINTALDGLTFTPANNASGAATLTLTTNDQGNSDFGGAKSDTDSVAINVLAVNTPPVNSVPGAQTTLEDTSLVFSSANGNAIQTSDADAGSSRVKVTLGVGSGTLTLASTTGLTFTAGDGVADGTMTFTGTLAAINTALDGLNFTPAADANGTVTLNIVTDDQGNTGSGGAKSDSDNVTINVTAVNDAPVNHLPPAQTVSGGGVLNLGSSFGAPLSISDVDAGSSPVQVTLTASVGTISLATTSGLTFTTGNGSSDSTMTFRGTVAAINTALDGMSYSPPLLLLSNPTIDITTNDLGNTGAGGAKSDSDTLSLNTTPSNQAPVNTVPGAQNINEDSALILSSNNGNAISIADPDANGNPEKVTLTANNGKLSLSGTSGLTFTTGDGSADGTMTFTGTLADINNALNGLVFVPTPDLNGIASIQIVTNDQGNTGAGGAKSDTSGVTIHVAAVNDAPILTVPAAQEWNEDVPLVLSSGNGNQISIVDVDAGSNAVQLMLSASNGTLSLSTTSGLSFTTGDGTADAAMVLTGSLASINAALNGLTFTPSANFNGAAAINVAVNDQGNTGSGGALSDSGSIGLTVDAVNDPPVNTVPSTQTVAEDGTLTLGGSAVSISDVDAGSSPMQVALSAADGLISLSQTTGLTFLAGDGTDDASIVVTGTIADINAALNGLVFKPAANFNGSAGIGIVTSDLGATGSGGVQTDVDGFVINVTAVNDGPTLSVPATQNTPFQTSTTLGGAGNNAIVIGDIDAATGLLELTLNASHGVLTLGSTSGLTFVNGDGTADASITVDGQLSDLYAAIDGMTFTPDAGFDGTASVSVTIDDQGNTGSGGSKTATNSFNVEIAADGAPIVITDPTTLAYTENEGAVLVDSSVTVSDSDSANLVGATVKISGFVAGQDWLDFTNQNGISGNFDSSTGTLTLSGAATTNDYQSALQSVAYRNSSLNPSDAARSIKFSVTDGTLDSNVAERALTVTPVNNAPTSSGLADVLVHEDAPQTNVDVAATISDVDDAGNTLSYALISNSNSALYDSAQIDASTGQLTLKYAHNANGDSAMSVRVTDPHGGFVDVPFNVHVSAVDDDPVVTLNSPLATDHGSTKPIDSSLLAISDVDNIDADLTCTLASVPAHGSLLLNGTALGVGDSFTQADVDNGALSFRPANEKTAASDSFSFNVSDGSGGTLGPVTFAIGLSAEPVSPPVSPSPPPVSPLPPPVAPPPVTPPPPVAPPPPVVLPPVVTPPVDVATGPSTPVTSQAGAVEAAPTAPSSTDTTTVQTTSRIDEKTTAAVLPPAQSSSSSGKTPSGGGSAPAAAAVVQQAAPPVQAPVAPPVEAKPELPKVETPVHIDPPPAPPAVVVAPPPAVDHRSEIAAAQAQSAIYLQSKAAAQQVAFVAAPDTALVHDLDTLKETVNAPSRSMTVVAGTAAPLAAGVSMIYLLWTIRGGYLLASLLSSMPAWRLVDPLPILEHFDDENERKRRRRDGETDDESLESLAEGGNADASAGRSIP